MQTLEAFVNTLASDFGRHVANVVIYPALVALGFKILQIGRRVYEIHQCFLPKNGESITDRIKGVENEVTVIRKGLHWKDSISTQETAMFELSPTGDCVHANRAMSNLLGLTREQLLGRGWLEAMIDTAERERAREALETAVKHNMPFRDTWRIHNRETGERFIGTVGTQMIRNKVGDKLLMFGSLEKTRCMREEERTNAAIPASEDTPTKTIRVQ